VGPIAASQDSQSNGPIGLVANAHYLALTVGCCTTYEVDALDLTQAAGPLKILSKPPSQAAFFTEGAVPGSSGLLAVRAFGTGSWYWMTDEAGVLNPFPLALGPDDGPITISADGTMVAVALPDHGAVIQSINSALPVASASSNVSAVATTPTPSARPSTTATAASPKKVNSKLQHPDGLAWSPDAKQLALAVSGEIQVYDAAAADGTAPTKKYLAGANVAGVAWSGPIGDRTYALVKPSSGPQAMVDALLTATSLPAQADTPANRPLTKVYLWRFDSTKTSPIESITDATPTVLATYPPLNAGVLFHHWGPIESWALLGGCYRYRVLITGSVTPPAPLTPPRIKTVEFDFLASHAESLPDKPAVVCGDEVLDFASLNRRASRVANASTGLGCREGDRVAWMSFNSIAGAEIASGLRRAGLVIVPVNYRLRGPEVAYVLNDSGARIAAAGPDHVEVVAAASPDVKGDVRFIAVGESVPAGWLSYREVVQDASDDFDAVGSGLGASMIYTSGTTGNPKGAWRPHGVDIGNVLQVISIFELAQSDVHLMCGPGYPSGVAVFSVLHQVLGATVVLQQKFDAGDALDLVERHRVT